MDLKKNDGNFDTETLNSAENPENYMSWDVSKPVSLRIQPDEIASFKPVTICKAFQDAVLKTPTNLALVYKSKETTQTFTCEQYYEEIIKAAKCLIQLGLQQYYGVGIIGFNSPEWFISNFAAIFAGGISTGIYATNSPEACKYIAYDAKCNIVIVEDNFQLQKFLKIWPDLPHLKAIIQYRGEIQTPQENVYTWEQMMNFETNQYDQELKKRINQLSPNMCSSIIYTSGTTGNPKGVMLSHDNITYTARKLFNYVFKTTSQPEILVSYLPLSHIAAQLLDIYSCIVFPITVYFANPDALRGSLGQTIREVRPTLFFGVPRVWEKMRDGLCELSKSNGFFERKIESWSKNIGYKTNMQIMNGQSFNKFSYQCASKLKLSKIRNILGFDRCSIFFTGAAPISKETLDFFLSLDIPIMEVYGMSECSGPHSIGIPQAYRLCSVGRIVPGLETKMDKTTSDIDPEICFRGRHVFMGYNGQEQKTRESFDSEGFLHSGDAGKFDEDGFLWITGRIKEILITAGGENIAPIAIEDKVKEYLPCISNCMLIGDKRKYLSILLTFKTDVNVNTMVPTDKLDGIALDWCKSIGCNDVFSVKQILSRKNKLIFEAIQEGIDKVNILAISRAQIIQKWIILPRDFSIPGGELGPTLKLKRIFVNDLYKDTIEDIYKDPRK